MHKVVFITRLPSLLFSSAYAFSKIFPNLNWCWCMLHELKPKLNALLQHTLIIMDGLVMNLKGEKPLHMVHSEMKAITHQCGQCWKLGNVPLSLLWRPRKFPFMSSFFSNDIFSFSGISLKQQRKQSPLQPASYSVLHQWRALLPLSSSVTSKKFLGCLYLPLLNCWYTESWWSFCLWKTLCS